MIELNLKSKALQALKDAQEVAEAAIKAGKDTAITGISSAEELRNRLITFKLNTLREILQTLDSLSRMTAQTLRRSIRDGVVGFMETAEEINSILKSKSPKVQVGRSDEDKG